MLVRILAATFWLLPVVFITANDSGSDQVWREEGLARQIPKYKRVTITPHPKLEGVAVANCETALSWWSELRVFHYSGDVIDWMAAFPASYAENAGHYVLSCNWEFLPKLGIWVLEVFDSTHMGNGSLWLFEFDGRTLRQLLHTEARGRFVLPPADLVIPELGDRKLVEEHLAIEYRTSTDPADAPEEVILTGTMAAFDGEGNESSSKPLTETWRWDAKTRVFLRVPR